MIAKFARSATMTHAKEHGTGFDASGGRWLASSLSSSYHPIFGRIEASCHHALGSCRRFWGTLEPASKQFPPAIRSRDLHRIS